MKKILVGIVIAVALLTGIGGLGLGIYAVMLSVENQVAAEVTETVETDLTQIAGYTPVADDVVAPLQSEMQGGNTHLVWETGKVQAGSRHDFDGTWTSLGGAVAYNPSTQELKAVEMVILIESFNSYGTEEPAPGGLVLTVLGKGTTGGVPWFNIEEHPNAVFTATTFIAKADAPEGFEAPANAIEGWTHIIQGSFDLNGTQVELSIPAVIAFEGEKLQIDATFDISRGAHDVAPANPIPLTEIDDVVNITVGITAEPDAGVAIGALAEMITSQGEIIAGNAQSIALLQRTRNQVQDLETQVASLNEQIDGLTELLEQVRAGGLTVPDTDGGSTGQVDLSGDPAQFTATVQYPNGNPIPFDMIRVPGDEAAGIEPFYMAKTEVTWDMFYNWAYSSDIDATASADLQARDLRPSPLYEDCDQLKLGLGQRPAVSMSRTTAEAFAKWVSEQTGMSFRLPTQAEWEHALELGGGVPATREALFAQAVFQNNAAEQDEPPFLWVTNEVGKTQPNALGIYDMIGNAAEWVTDTGADRVVRGGHFMQNLDEEPFTADWRAVEDQEVWNLTYPQRPLSRFWYRDHFYQGIRLVCDAK